MKNPDKVLCLIEDVGIRKCDVDPKRIYFGDTVCEGNRDLIFRYNLKKRPFLGTTTMDPELSLISANMAKVCEGERERRRKKNWGGRRGIVAKYI